MRKLFLVFTLISFSCKSNQPAKEATKLNLYNGLEVFAEVSKVDSIGNYYLVFIENDQKFFKIVSKKDQPKYYKSAKLKTGERYTFRIEPLTNREAAFRDGPFKIGNYLDIDQCRKFSETKICTEFSFELAIANNLDGLFLRRDE